MSPKKVVIGLDPAQERSEDALELGAVLCEALAAKPVVVAALPYALSSMSVADISISLHEDTEEVFERAGSRLERLAPETHPVASRSPAAALSEVAGVEAAVAIVIGSTKRGPLGRVLPGGTGQNLLNNAPCAVAVAPRDYAKDEHSLLRIGVAFDGSAEASTALETAIGLTQRLHGQLTIISVAEHVRVGYSDAMAALGAAATPIREEREKKEMLRTALRRVPVGLPVEGHMPVGDVGDEISARTAELDLLLIGSRGYGPVRRTLLGSASASAMRSASCPLLILPRVAGSDPLGMQADVGSASPTR